MKCPNCHRELPDGALLCEYCGSEIQLVADFSEELDQAIQESLDVDKVSDLIEEENGGRAEATPEAPRPQSFLRTLLSDSIRRRSMILWIVVALMAGALLVFGIMQFRLLRLTQSAPYLVGEAYAAAAEENYHEAAEFIRSAIEVSEEDDATTAELELLLSEYLFKEGRFHEASEHVDRLCSNAGTDENICLKAAGLYIEYLSREGDYLTIAKWLDSIPNEAVNRRFSAYLIKDPVITPGPGTYLEDTLFTIESGCEGSVFYTVDGSDPNTASILYKEPFHLEEGEVTIRAITVNRYGLMSSVVSGDYVIDADVPEPPVILTKEGVYNQPTLIRAEIPTDGRLYYTIDGTDPTTESREYSGDLTMPLGKSVFRFATIDAEEHVSEIVECRYELTVSSAVRIEDGHNYILVELIKAGEVVTTDGVIRDGSARYAYTYQGLRQIEGYGNFYIYSELLVDPEGNSVRTGRRFAINISNATVNLYEENGDSYRLTPMQ